MSDLGFDFCTRRRFLQSAVALGTGAIGAGTVGTPLAFCRQPPPPESNKKVAAIVTNYRRYSHADNIVTRFIEGYCIFGKTYAPPCRVASLFIDQVNEFDIGRPIARWWEVPLVDTISEALTLGTGKLAVDGVLLIAEQGDYPENERGQKLYPRRKFFEEVVKVFRASGRSVPVYIDKHFSYSWDDARWMYDQSRELDFPMMAGSSIPVATRIPDLQPPPGVEWQSALGVGYGHFEVYGFHTLEGLQVMTERRRGGETGVRAVQCLQGKDAWAAAKSGQWDRTLLDAAVTRVPEHTGGKIDDVDAEALVYLVEYNDGLHGAAYLSPQRVGDFAFGGRIKGQADPVSCWYETPKPQRDHFSYLSQHVGRMMITGKPTYPVERTLLTTGMLAAVMESKADGCKRIETPNLNVRYTI